MKTAKIMNYVITLAAAVSIGVAALPAGADEPCGDFGECKVLVEINATDGDIGFHFLGDADDLRAMRIDDPNGAKIFENGAFGALREQKLTENFGESAEPLCWFNPEEEEEWDEVVTLREFVDRWTAGTYHFLGKGEEGEKLYGATNLSFDLPAAPAEVDFNGSTITWMPGNDLGNCAPFSPELAEENGVDTIAEVVNDFVVADPAGVAVAAFEVVMEPDVEDGDPIGDEIFSIRVSGSTLAVDVPALYLASLPADTPVKIEVGAIGVDDNATFTEVDGFCINEAEGCEEEDD
jgi:hypothetical protein